MMYLLLFILVVFAFMWGLDVVASSFFPHAGAKLAEASGITILYLIFAVLTSRRKKASDALDTGADEGILLAYASQTGVAEDLARKTAAALIKGGQAVRFVSFSDLTKSSLMEADKALFIVSTTGEGDAPDMAAPFASRVMAEAIDLAQMQYAVLALGDSNYRDYCAFGRQLDAWLAENGAQPLFERVDVDCVDNKAIKNWFTQVGMLGAASDTVALPEFQPWQLKKRSLLNSGSQNLPVFHVALGMQENLPSWQAGDIAVIRPGNDPVAVDKFLQKTGFEPQTSVTVENQPFTLAAALSGRVLPDDGQASVQASDPQVLLDMLPELPRREYSLASIPQDGKVELVIRQVRREDGAFGIGSGWLTEIAPLEGPVDMFVRPNPSFHGPEDDRPMILIGAGSGIAGLRAHIKERALAGYHRNWLVFGERDAEVDYLFREEIEDWCSAGVLKRLDLCFMEDGVQRMVQDALFADEAALHTWLADGASIYVSGSKAHLGAGMDAALKKLLGEEGFLGLIERGCYKRDVY